MQLDDTIRRRIFLRHLLHWCWSDRYRNLLSVTGLVAGMAGIIVTLSILIADNHKLIEQLRLVGVRTIYVTADRGRLPEISSAGFRASFPAVERTALVTVSQATLRTPTGSMIAAPVLGVDAAYFEILKPPEVRGRLLSQTDIRLGNTVCLLGQALAETLGSPATIRCRGVVLRVVGTVAAPSTDIDVTGIAAAMTGSSVWVPASLGMISPYGPGVSRSLLVQASSESKVEQLKLELAKFLRHRVVGTVQVASSRELLARYRSTMRHVARVIGGISFLALFLGGIGLMNNMLAVVLERLPEIGVRISMGASRRDIVLQFLAEALLISLLGSLAGTTLGILITVIIGSLGVVPVAVPLWLPCVPPVIGVFLGVVFGALPAARAAHHQPIEPLTFRAR